MFSCDFMDNLSTSSISFKLAVVYTFEQNSYSEKKGGMLTTKARTMRITAHLLQQLWPEAIRTAGYIANRTPMRKHEWKMPYELVKKCLLNLAHLKVYRCKAYSKINIFPKKQKFAKHVYIGHLISYNSTNIFCIWISSKSKVIRIWDVIFDEYFLYQLKILDLLQLIKELMIEILFKLFIFRQQLTIKKIDSDIEFEVNTQINASDQ